MKHNRREQQLGLEQFRLIRDEGLSLEGDAAHSPHFAHSNSSDNGYCDHSTVKVDDVSLSSQFRNSHGSPEQKGGLKPQADEGRAVEPSRRSDEPPCIDSSPVQADEGPAVTPSTIVEAVLFVGHSPVSAEELAGLVPRISTDEVEQIVADLAERYRRQGRPYEVIHSAEGYYLRLRDRYEPMAYRLYARDRAVRLSRAAVEVLALVAYRQPIRRQEVENFRGSDCGAVLRQLVRRGLIEIHRDGEGYREVFYQTTDRFRELFDLSSVDNLPQAQDLERL